MSLLEISHLTTKFETQQGTVSAVRDVSYHLEEGEVLGIVGESGSGKSVTARSLIKLLPETATTSGAVYLSNRAGTEELEVLSLSGEQLREMRGAEAAMVFQEPNSVLNPVYTIGWQIEEGLRAHGMKDKKELRAKSIDILKKVGIPDAETRIDYYPHQFSGGQKQRIVIAMALVLNPGLILADEPTTALDVTVQAEILDLLRLARDEFDASVLIITHNMGVIADIADEVVVMYRGHVVEQGSVEQIFYSPKDDYTKRLLAAVPRIGQKLVVKDADGKVIEREKDWRDQPIAVEAKGLTITYPGHLMQPDFKAVDGIDFTIHRSEVLGLVGESGSGKSTLVNQILYPVLADKLNGARIVPGKHTRVEGVDQCDKVIHVDQNPIGRTPRSNPATYTGVWDKIRTLFAKTPEAQVRGYGPGRFSFNVKGGRCEACHGDGTLKIEMNFLPDVYVDCEECHGQRYNRETLEVKYNGKSVADVLNMPIEEAAQFFKAYPSISRYLDTLVQVGLGYIRLGQPAPTLSGGESQRVKLATELQRRSTGKTVYILDEPTTGLHIADVHRLIEVLQKLVDAGNTVIVIEHNLDLIKCADHIIDLGPEGGSAGGLIVAEGTPEQVAEVEGSFTGQYLKPLLEKDKLLRAQEAEAAINAPAKKTKKK